MIVNVRRCVCLLVAGILLGCDSQLSSMLSYDELKRFPVDCAKADQQLKQLRQIQLIKNFNSDPDNLNEEDRAYNSLLKATIWWFASECELS
jgi:hypothetical protein